MWALLLIDVALQLSRGGRRQRAHLIGRLLGDTKVRRWLGGAFAWREPSERKKSSARA